jgi:hypothetical protein
MTSKVTVKANAGKFAFDRNEGCKGRPQMGQSKQCWYGSHTDPERFR